MNNRIDYMHGVVGRQRGSALIIVVILLLFASIFTIFALNVGVFEQRTTGNEIRAKIVHEAAEAGLNQGAELFNLNRALLNENSGDWVLCGNSEVFPCGAIDPLRRPTVYYYNGGAGAGLLTRNLPIPNPVQNVGGFAITVGVGALLCRVRAPEDPSDPVECATTAADATSTSVVTLVSRAEIPGEGSHATVATTIGAFNPMNLPMGVPPILASGSIEVTGGIQVVTNPNAGGNGVPVSVWTRRAVSKTGTPNTCYLDEFLRDGGSGNASDRLRIFEGMAICHSCGCPSDGPGALSFPMSGNKACQGIDILDIDNNAANDCPIAPNRDVRPEEFPCDLFEFIFGVKAWRDTNADHFCDQAIYVNDPENPGVLIRADELYLRQNARIIITSTSQCNLLDTAEGLVWMRANCGMNNRTIGSPQKPVVLVVDQSAKFTTTHLYGLLFVRATADSLNANTGGNAELEMMGNSVIYGAAVIQGQMTKGAGTAAIVFNQQIIQAFNNNPANLNFGALPGAWTDRVRY